ADLIGHESPKVRKGVITGGGAPQRAQERDAQRHPARPDRATLEKGQHGGPRIGSGSLTARLQSLLDKNWGATSGTLAFITGNAFSLVRRSFALASLLRKGARSAQDQARQK